MAYSDGLSAGDRYRLQVTHGSMVKNFFSLKRKKTRAVVSIIDTVGAVVWTRAVETVGEAHRLSDLIQTQVFSAQLKDFEHWLRTESSSSGSEQSSG